MGLSHDRNYSLSSYAVKVYNIVKHIAHIKQSNPKPNLNNLIWWYDFIETIVVCWISMGNGEQRFSANKTQVTTIHVSTRHTSPHGWCAHMLLWIRGAHVGHQHSWWESCCQTSAHVSLCSTANMPLTFRLQLVVSSKHGKDTWYRLHCTQKPSLRNQCHLDTSACLIAESTHVSSLSAPISWSWSSTVEHYVFVRCSKWYALRVSCQAFVFNWTNCVMNFVVQLYLYKKCDYVWSGSLWLIS